MPTPYIGQLKPAVGGGLGGMPARQTVVAAAASTRSYPVQLQAVGSKITKTIGASFTFEVPALPAGNGLGLICYTPVATNLTTANGFRYDSTGMLGFASDSTTFTGTTRNPQSFAGGMLAFESTAGVGRFFTTNGTTTTLSTLVTIPASGTLDGGDSYSALNYTLSIMPGAGQAAPMCLDASGNMVILFNVNISSVTWLAVFVISPAGTVVTKKKLVALDSSSQIKQSSCAREIRRSGSGYVIASAYYGSGSTNGGAFWNVTSDFVLTESAQLLNFSMADGNSAGTAYFFLSKTAAMLAFGNSAYGGYVAAPVNSSGQVVNNTPTVSNQSVGAGGVFSTSGGRYRYDAANDMFTMNSGPAPAQIASLATAYTRYTAALAANCVQGDGTYAVLVPSFIAAVATPYNMNGISSSFLSYLGDGYWATVASISTLYTIELQLWKEV